MASRSDPNPDNCPSREQLSAYLRGDLPDAALDDIGTHVSGCTACGSIVQLIEASPSPPALALWGELAGSEAGLVAEGSHDRPTAEWEGMPATARVSLGQLLPTRLGPYRLVARLGRGGMGVVYRAQHLHLKKWVAVKVLPLDRLADPPSVARFYREMEVVGRLDHPNIVRATDGGDANGVHFLVLELVDGVDLARLLQRCGPLPVAAACELVRQAALGLQHAHENGLVHRDLKPQNLILSARGEVKVLDLGLALLHGAGREEGLTGAGQVMGTPDYMAPEQWESSHAVDIRADVYSLGCTLYALLAGRPPFAGVGLKSMVRKMAAHTQESPAPVTDHRAEVPPALATLVARMLAKDPADRPATPADLARELEPFASDADLVRLRAVATRSVDRPGGGADDGGANEFTHRPNAVTVTGPAAVSRSSRRRTSLLTAAGLGVLAIGTVGTLSLYGRRPGTDDRQSPGGALAVDTNPIVTGKPHPVPTLGPRAFSPRKWHDLLDRPPTEFSWWNPAGQAHWTFDPDSRRLWVHGFVINGLLSFGRTDAPGYRLQLGVMQTDWAGDFGVFFGGRTDPATGVVHYQYVTLQGRSRKQPPEFFLRRGKGETRPRPGLDPLPILQGLTSGPIRPPGPGEHRLELEVTRHGLAGLRWNGEPCTLIDAADANRKFGPTDYRGEFGLYCWSTAVTVTAAQIMTTE